MGPRSSSIVDADPDLAELLAPEDLERARREALARVQRLSPGEWDAPPRSSPTRTTAGS